MRDKYGRFVSQTRPLKIFVSGDKVDFTQRPPNNLPVEVFEIKSPDLKKFMEDYDYYSPREKWIRSLMIAIFAGGILGLLATWLF
jgi:hypothetical protein